MAGCGQAEVRRPPVLVPLVRRGLIQTRGSDDDVLLTRAESTSSDYLARNEPYGSEVTGDEIIFTNNGEVLGRATLTI